MGRESERLIKPKLSRVSWSPNIGICVDGYHLRRFMYDRDCVFPGFEALRRELMHLSTGVLLRTGSGSSQTSYWDALLDKTGETRLLNLNVGRETINWYTAAGDALLQEIPDTHKNEVLENFLPLKVTAQKNGVVIHQKGVDARIITDMFDFTVHRDVPRLLLLSNDSDFAAPLKLVSTLGYETYLVTLPGSRPSKALVAAVDEVLSYEEIRRMAEEMLTNLRLRPGANN